MNSCTDVLHVAVWLIGYNKTVFYTFRKPRIGSYTCMVTGQEGVEFNKHVLNF